MSLADELLADLEADEDEDNEESFDDSGKNHQFENALGDSLTGTIPMEQEKETYSLKDVAKLFKSSRLKNAMDRIEYFSSNKHQNEMDDLQGPVEADPEYLLIVE